MNLTLSHTRQKLNFRYVPGGEQEQAHDNFGTINSEGEQEEIQMTKRVREYAIPHQLNSQNEPQFRFGNQKTDASNTYNFTQEGANLNTETVFATPTNKNQVFQSSIIANNIRYKSGWKDPVDSESAGASKTTLSTQRPLISG